MHTQNLHLKISSGIIIITCLDVYQQHGKAATQQYHLQSTKLEEAKKKAGLTDGATPGTLIENLQETIGIST
jgi:hypothetical protein